MCCVHSSNSSILWNGYKLDSFAPAQSLRQDDSISPYLFVLCVEKFAICINQVVQENKWLPIHISSEGPSISCLFFADDVLLFSKGRSA